MTTETYIWIIVFCLAALLFFGTAGVITVIGLKDLRDLLSRSSMTSPQTDPPQRV